QHDQRQGPAQQPGGDHGPTARTVVELLHFIPEGKPIVDRVPPNAKPMHQHRYTGMSYNRR
ncbi:MAG: hypothetical protein WA637_08145, partial [Terriglobales bacterium]